MSLTIGELLARPQLRLELIVAGDLDREIRWVHSSDMPDPGPYLRGAELVLTAGIWYWHGTAAGSFAASLGRAGAAGLGFGVSPLVEEVPDELIEACRAWGLTLFGVPSSVAFIQIAEEFVEAQHRLRERPLLESLDRSSRFVASLQVGGGLDGLLRVLARLVPRPAAIVQRGHGVIASINQPAGLPDGLDAIEFSSTPATRMRDLGRLTAFPIPIDAFEVALVIETGSEPLSVPERAIVDQALGFITIELQRQRAVAESERRFVGELFDLTAAGPAQLPLVTARLRSLGLDPDASLCAVACSGGDPEATREALAAYLAATGRPGVVAVKATTTLAIVQVEPEEDLTALAEALPVRRSEEFVGLGGIVPDAAGLARSLLEATHACRFAQRRGAEGFATRDTLASHVLLIGLQDDRLLDSFRRTLIAPLEEHDERRRTDLVTTLEMFLGSGGRYQQTAEALHLHVNSLRLRLSRIEQLTGRDLGSMDDRVDLWIALRSRKT